MLYFFTKPLVIDASRSVKGNSVCCLFTWETSGDRVNNVNCEIAQNAIVVFMLKVKVALSA